MKQLLPLLFLFCNLAISAQDATDIVKKANDKLRGANTSGKMSMRIERPAWSREISMKTWSRGTGYSLILITAPARDQGTTFLKRQNEIYQWMPNVERTVKLPPSMMMQSWMGSDFTNDDLVEESSMLRDYSHQLEGDTSISGRETWKITLTPNSNAAVVWGKVIVYISKKEHLQLRTEFYDEDGSLVNILEGQEIKELGGRTLPSKLVMTPMEKEDHRTILTYEKLEFDVDIPNGFFTTQNMKRVR